MGDLELMDWNCGIGGRYDGSQTGSGVTGIVRSRNDIRCLRVLQTSHGVSQTGNSFGLSRYTNESVYSQCSNKEYLSGCSTVRKHSSETDKYQEVPSVR